MKINEQAENKLKTKLTKTVVCSDVDINKNKLEKLNLALRKNLIRRKEAKA